MRGYIVYLHRNGKTNDIFYVGKGSNRGRAYEEYNRSTEWYSVVDKDYFNVDLIGKGLTEDEAYDLEMLTIETLGLDNLVNKTTGGLGSSGYRHTKLTKDKISESTKKWQKSISKGERGEILRRVG